MPHVSEIARHDEQRPLRAEPRPATRRSLDPDLRLALLSGAAGWRDRSASYSSSELAAVAALATATVATVTLVLVVAGLSVPTAPIDGSGRWAAAILACAAILLGVLPGLLWPVGWRLRWDVPPAVIAGGRVSLAFVVIGLWVALLGPLAPIPGGVLGLLVGGELTLTSWSLGVRLAAVDWWLLFQRSWIHLGVLLATGITATLTDGREVEIVLVWVLFQVVAFGAALTCGALARLRAAIDVELVGLRRGAGQEAHARLAHWLHDEITSGLRLLRLRLEADVLGPAEAAAELEGLEHRLRIRQLEESLATGDASIAEVVQPYVRLIQHHGAEATDVPRFTEASAHIGAGVGRSLQRALAVLVPNALAAGATQVALRVQPTGSGLVVEVEDDAGGFDLDAVPAGRGLDRLRRELGEGRLTCERTERGSVVVAVVEPLEGA